ncbi:DUF6585 family protein [Streptomyces sp. NPDC001920]
MNGDGEPGRAGDHASDRVGDRTDDRTDGRAHDRTDDRPDGRAHDRTDDRPDNRTDNGTDDRTDDRADQLLLARVSEAAGRAGLGRRRGTYRGPFAAPRGLWAAVADIRRRLGQGGRAETSMTGARTGPAGTRTGPTAALLGLTRALSSPARALSSLASGQLGPAGARFSPTGARLGPTRPRLDLYEHGLTIAVDGRIHVVRYATTEIRRRRTLSRQGITRAQVVIGVDGEPVVLRPGDFEHPKVWCAEISRAVTDARVPVALAALARGARLTFGPVWITRDEVGSRGTSLGWAQIERIEVLDGSVAVRAAGRWQVWRGVASGIPNLCVFRALVEQLTAVGQGDDD